MWVEAMTKLILLLLLLAGCATAHPSRNMNEMSTDDLVRELSRPL